MLSLREHVARRAVERSFRSRVAGVEAWDRLCLDIDAAVAPLFGRGRRLRDGDVDRLADMAASGLESLSPLVVLDKRREPTRAKPKGEMREILCVSPYAAEERGRRFVEVSTLRIALSRKRAVIETASTCMRITGHAMERAIERGVVEEDDGVEHRFTRQMLCHAGIVVMGRSLLGRGDLEWSDTLPLPFDDALILGGFIPGENVAFDRLVYDGAGRFPSPATPSDLLTESPGDGGGGSVLPVYKGATVIGCGEMTCVQGELWDALREFATRHRQVVNGVGEALLWPGSVLRPSPSFAGMRPAYEAALDDLRALLHDPALNARRGARPVLRAASGEPAEELVEA